VFGCAVLNWTASTDACPGVFQTSLVAIDFEAFLLDAE
jgi:hypothetical protein